ncbi:MAG: DUF29 domain-containing protein [Aquificaceae bacterium]|nr:DUF29 domain-containing protein [Aquificaceae bacterium]
MRVLTKEELKKLYDKDFPLWAEINLELLKEKAYELVDWENLLEEIEDMARRHLDSAVSYIAVILEHLYKWDNFRNLAGGDTAGMSWIRSVENARLRAEVLLDEYPSLRKKLPEELQKAWKKARTELIIWLKDKDLNPESFNIPMYCPYNYETAMMRDLRKEMES